ncbi:GH16650 [Drosophila grimshawi]|uniref:GH16650 n=2 Tax=Drosophila grimshawi TaxID=7222 RepID=B4J2N1_DROGR|nr:GH16650 [Drosophila grimshawi]
MSPSGALSVTKPILCIGRLSIDLLTVCANGSDAGALHSCLEAQWRRGGHSSNVSIQLHMLGAQVEFFGMLSRSSLLIEMLQEMRRCNIELSHCPRTDEEPDISTIWKAQKTGCRTILYSDSQKFPYVTFEDFKLLDLGVYGWVHFEARNVRETIRMMRAVWDYNNGRTAAERILISLKVTYDVCFKEIIDLFDMCDFVIFSRQLAQQLGWQTPKETCLQLDKKFSLPRSFHVRRPCLICGWGLSGSGCLDALGKYYELPANICGDPVDAYGAGNCFAAAVIYALYLRQMTLPDAVAFGNRLAGHKVTSSGYNHLSKLNTFPVDTVHDDTHRASNMPEDEEVDGHISRKYLERSIESSNGVLSTKLLQPFNPNDYKMSSP